MRPKRRIQLLLLVLLSLLVAAAASLLCQWFFQQGLTFSPISAFDSKAEPPTPSPAETGIPLQQGQRQIYELWQYERRLASVSSSPLVKPEQNQLITALNQMLFVSYDERQRTNFRAYRDAVAGCAPKEGFERGYCVGQIMWKRNAVVGDWALDEEAASRFGDAQFSKDISAQESLMKSLSLGIGPGRLPGGSALVFAELYLLTEKLINVSVTHENSHALRAAILAVDPSLAESYEMKLVLNDLRSKIVQLSMRFGGDNWDPIRFEGLIYVAAAWIKLRIPEEAFVGTKYESVAKGVATLRKLDKK